MLKIKPFSEVRIRIGTFFGPGRLKTVYMYGLVMRAQECIWEKRRGIHRGPGCKGPELPGKCLHQDPLHSPVWVKTLERNVCAQLEQTRTEVRIGRAQVA